MTFEIWIAFVAATSALLLIPGPTVLLVISYALSKGKRVALATVAGVALGDFVAMVASLAGLGALMLASATLFIVLKWIGAAYLIYLGIKLIRSASASNLGQIDHSVSIPAKGVFLHAAAVTALNPKSIIFFIAFVPQFITSTNALFPQLAILTVTFVGLATINALMYVLLATQLRSKITKPSVFAWLSRMGGSALIVMGIATAVIRRANT